MLYLPNTGNPHQSKDQLKANKANKFIGRGSPGSSTDKYSEVVNCRSYVPTDIVFISVNGVRFDRLTPDFNNIAKALMVGVTFITDNKYDRQRAYNCGERGCLILTSIWIS